MGWTEYEPIAARYRVPIVVTGFEPLDLLEGILMAVRQLEAGRARSRTSTRAPSSREGNPARPGSRSREVFEVGDRKWRGIGTIPAAATGCATAYARFDAERRFDVGDIETAGVARRASAGEILTATKKPLDCPAFGTLCTPQTPLGAPMVSSEGTCAAFCSTGRHRDATQARRRCPGDADGASR